MDDGIRNRGLQGHNHVPGFQALGLVIDLPPNEEAAFEIQVLSYLHSKGIG